MLQSIRPRKYQHTEFNFLVNYFTRCKLSIIPVVVLLRVRILPLLVPWFHNPCQNYYRVKVTDWQTGKLSFIECNICVELLVVRP